MSGRIVHTNTRSRLRKKAFALSRGTAVFEMTVLMLTASMILCILAQGAILFFRASEVKNLAHLGSIYAAANPGFSAAAVQNYVLANSPGDIGANGGAALDVVVNPATSPRDLGSAVTVTVAYSYDQSKSFGARFFGFAFPSTLTSSDTGATQ